MTKKQTPATMGAKKVSTQPYRYASPNVPMSAIRRFARQIAQKFHPEKIVLFGSYAYGQPHEESDVDLLVIMPADRAIGQAIRIVNAFDDWPFLLDLIVRTPSQVDRGLSDPDDRDWFLYEIMTKGKLLYEAKHSAVDSKGGRRLRRRSQSSRARKTDARHRVLPLPANTFDLRARADCERGCQINGRFLAVALFQPARVANCSRQRCIRMIPGNIRGA